MITSPQTIQVRRGESVAEATIAWRYEDRLWVVAIESPSFDPVQARADDAFEALSLVRDQLEPEGWRIGVAGSRADVWPSGMARDQGGGLRAYRITDGRAGDLVDTFEPVDPSSVATVAEQREAADRFYEESARRSQGG